MSSRAYRTTLGIAALSAVIYGLLFCFTTTLQRSIPSGKKAEHSATAELPSALSNSSAPLAAKPRHTSPLAERLNAADGNAKEDVETLVGLIGQYFTSMQNRQGWPLGSSRDLARVLTGDNPLHLTVIASNHPAINARGYLVDRWGTPYHLHQLSSRVIDVRSAGPDRELFTADDVVNDSAHAHQPSDR